MKNLDFYHDLLNHSLCYKYNVQVQIAREYSKLIKENTNKKSILVTSSCPKYISDIFNKNGITPILNDTDRHSLFYSFNEIIKNIKNDKKYNYQLIAKNFPCSSYSYISDYIKEINRKLVESNNSDVNTILGLMIDIPNYYLDSVNLINQYEYHFETQKPSLTYKKLFTAVYDRLKNPNTFNYAIKELISLIVLYYDVMNIPVENYMISFLNPIVEPVKSSMMKSILSHHQIQTQNTMESLSSLEYVNMTESPSDLVENETDKTSFEMYMYGFNVTCDGEIDISNHGFTSNDIISDMFYLYNKYKKPKVDFRISEQELMALKTDHGSKFLNITGFLLHPIFIIEYCNKLYLIYKNHYDKFDLNGIELKTGEQRHNNTDEREIIGIDLESDVKYEFVI